MTLIVAWRDPFCLVADSLESGIYERKSSVGPGKIVQLSEEMVLGLAGPSSALPEIEEGVRRALPAAASWWDLERDTKTIVGDINDRMHRLVEMVTVVIAGTVGGQPGFFDEGPFAVSREPSQTALSQPFAFAGSGGICASAARALASMCRPDLTRENLLRTIIEAAVKMDPGQTGNEIWRADLVGAIAPYEWLCVLPKRQPTQTGGGAGGAVRLAF